MSNPTLQVGESKWASKPNYMLGYYVDPQTGKYRANEFNVNRNSPKWVLGKNGQLVQYASDEIALAFNADGTERGVLIEPASKNDCLQSEDLTTTWTTIRATITADDTTAPDGTTTADKLGDDNSGGTGTVSVRQTISVLANTQYTASIFLKADQLSYALIFANDYDGGTGGSQYFGLSGSGSLGTAVNLDDSKIEAYPNGWYRCSITWTQGAADTSFTLIIYVASSISSATVDLDSTSSIFVWGAQVEKSPIATSYIPTTSSKVTRLKDDVYLTGASDLIGQSEGTLFVEVDWKNASGTTQYLLSVNDGTSGNRMLIYTTGLLRMFAAANGTILTNQGVSAMSYSGVQKIAFAYKTDDFKLYRNGSSISSDTVGSLAALSTLTDIYLGQRFDAIEQANMHIRTVAIYKTRLSDAECEALTTL